MPTIGSGARATHIEHPELVRVIDTRTWKDDIPGVGYHDKGDLVTFHVTDDAKKLLQSIRRGQFIAAYGERGKYSELGPGLYVAGNPDYWVGRARNKWSFLKRMTPDQTAGLIAAIRARVEEMREKRWLSSNEYEYAIRDLGYVEQGHYDTNILVRFSDQPYNIKFWEPKFLSPLGIRAGEAPEIVELRLRGTFAEVSRSHPDPSLLRLLRRAGVDGVYTRASMSTNPEMAIWNKRAVVSARQMDVRPRD